MKRLLFAGLFVAAGLSAQGAPDSIAVWHQRGCQIPCIDYRIVLGRNGTVQIQRSDEIRITLHLADSVITPLYQQLHLAMLDSLPDSFPRSNRECDHFLTHAEGVVLDIYAGTARRRIVDNAHGCGLNPDVFGATPTEWVNQLHRFESALDKAVGIERWLAR